MFRSGCFGECPIYAVKVSADGTVRFDGREFVLDKGIHTDSISRTSVEALAQAIDSIRFDELRESYRYEPDGCKEWWSDNPSVDIVVTRAEGKKHVGYYYGCRGIDVAARIDGLARKIDELSGTARWVGQSQ
jgi:hypothetical protein